MKQKVEEGDGGRRGSRVKTRPVRLPRFSGRLAVARLVDNQDDGLKGRYRARAEC